MLALIFVVFASNYSRIEPYNGPPADFVIKNAKIITIDKNNPRA